MNWEGREGKYSLSIVMQYIDMQQEVSEENHNTR